VVREFPKLSLVGRAELFD